MKETLRDLFRQKFNYSEYRKVILQNLLHAQELMREPEFLEETNDGDRIYGLGYLRDADGKEIGLYYTNVTKGDVRHKRVGFRKMMKKYTEFGVDAAITVFADKEHWRLSYMCDLKGGVTAAKRFSYIMGDGGMYVTPVNRLSELAGKRIKLEDIHDAFSVEALSDEFFKAYHDHYDIIVAALARLGMTGAVYHDYVKKMMGRIVFLHFLQKKGWLNDNPVFLRDLFFFSPHKDDFLDQVLEPLFFGIFNTEKGQREKLFASEHWDKNLLKEWESMPYLNGGLFERDEIDKMAIKLPASLFDDLFSFLASYNFTVDENDPDDAEIGVDPEMLGKIFESLLEDNKAKGAFYTPKEIVRYMCKESLIAHLASKLPDVADNVVRAFVESHEMQPELEPCRDDLESALREVKICDPAIGSGAFPMGLLNELWRCREALGTELSRLQLKKEIIENNIYGVDIERGAIDIARLRFWLSIVVDSDKAEPLPNFDYKFMQGNSLIESYGGFDLSRISSRLRGGQSKSMQLVLGLDSDFSKKNLQRLIRDYFKPTDHKQKASMRHAINDEVKRLILNSVGGTPTFLAKLEQLDPSANQEFFLWHTWFKDIFDGGGFDIVIGNPPYISAPTQMANETLTLQRERIISSKRFKSLFQKWDLYIPFIELGILLNVTSGVTTMIVPFPLTNQLYAKILRKMLVENNDMYELVDLNGTKIFENATVSNCIPFIKKTKTHGETWVSKIDENFKISRSFLQNHEDLVQDKKTYVWNVTQEKRKTSRFANMHVLGDYCYISKGMVLYSEEGLFTNKDLISDTQDRIHCRKYIEAKDIECYEIQRVRFIEYNTDRVPNQVSRPTFRELYDVPKLITNCLGDLKVTVDIDEHYICQQGLRIAVLWKDIKNVNNKSITTSIQKYSTLSRATMESLSSSIDIRYLLGIMASKLGNELLKIQRAGDYHIVPEHIRNIPIAYATQEQQQAIINLVDIILSTKKDNPQTDTSALEREIDHQVYALYNLTPEEIAVIEKNTQ